MKRKDSLYIAETDELGRIVCVWVTDDMTPRPKPVRHPKKHIPHVSAKTCSGASPAEITMWMQQHVR